MAPRRRTLLHRAASPTAPGTSPETRGETKPQSATILSATAFHRAEVQEAKHRHRASLLHTPQHHTATAAPPPHHPIPALKNRTATPYLPHQMNHVHGPHTSNSEQKQQLNTHFAEQTQAGNAPLAQSSLAQAPLMLLKGINQPPAPLLFPQGLRNHPQLQSCDGNCRQVWGGQHPALLV